MNYSKIYRDLIINASKRKLSGYFEVHHAIPKCMGGNNDKHNLVALTPEEHYVAHQLLVKIFPDEPGLIRAAIGMTARKKVKGYVSNKLYGWLKRKNSEQVSKRMKGNKHLLGFTHSKETKDKISAATKGKKKPESMRKKLSDRVSGKNNPMYGKPRTKEQKDKQSFLLSGSKNANYDKRLHVFERNSELFIGTSWDFRTKKSIEQSCVAHVIRGKYKTTHGWKYLGLFENEKELQCA